jgi:hypothetical protein
VKERIRPGVLLPLPLLLIWFGFEAMDDRQTDVVAWYVIAGSIGMTALVARLTNVQVALNNRAAPNPRTHQLDV